jgi:hypothetical protein
MAPRYRTFSDGRSGHFITDESDQGRIMAHSFSAQDVETILAALNVKDNPRLRQLLATELCDFRLKLEHDNGGSLTQEPAIALLLEDLCDFLGFTTGEKALVLGSSLLVYLSFISNTPTDAIQVIDSTVAEQALF